MSLPGWDSVDTVSRLARFFTIAGFVSLFFLGACEVLGYMYGNRKDELIQAEQRRLQDQQTSASEVRDRDQRQAETERQTAIMQALDRQRAAEKKLGALEEKQAPRVLSATQKAALSGFLAKHQPSTVTIKSSINAPDARAYAEQFAVIMRQSGWQVSIDNAIFTGTDISGIWIVFKDRTATPGGAVTLYDAFKAAGMPIRAVYDPGVSGEQDIWLSIGAK